MRATRRRVLQFVAGGGLFALWLAPGRSRETRIAALIGEAQAKTFIG